MAFSQPLDRSLPSTGDNDQPITCRVMSVLPVITWDQDAKQRRVIPMRWGFPHRSNPNRPDPIHVRAETIDEKPTFRDAFRGAQRGIVLVKTFNEGLELSNGKTEQHTITLGDQGSVGIAFLWKRFPSFACVMATVPASKLIGSITDRMPAILDKEAWAIWLGETPATPAEVKACLKTVEDTRWTMSKEEQAAKAKRQKPTVNNPTGKF